MTRVSTIGKQLAFRATMETWAEGMDYCAVPVPASITKALGTRAAVPVLARVNDSEPFQISLFPVGGGKHYIRIKAKVREETNTKTGDIVRIRFTVLDREDVALPEDLEAALRKERMKDAFAALPAGKRSFIVRRIGDAAKPETRAKRIQEAVTEAQRARDEKPAPRGRARATR